MLLIVCRLHLMHKNGLPMLAGLQVDLNRGVDVNGSVSKLLMPSVLPAAAAIDQQGPYW